MHILFLPIIFINFVNIKQESLRYMQQNFVSFGLLCFARQWPLNCGKIYDMDFVANFMENTIVKNLKINQHLSKL